MAKKRPKYRLELFVGGSATNKKVDKFFFRLKAGGHIVLTSGEGYAKRATRNRIAQNVAASFKDGHVEIRDMNPPVAQLKRLLVAAKVTTAKAARRS